jgi:hypothetical protein
MISNAMKRVSDHRWNTRVASYGPDRSDSLVLEMEPLCPVVFAQCAIVL